MKHSRAFREAQARLHEQEAAIKKEIESDSAQAIKSGKRIFAILTVGFFTLILGKFLMGRGGESRPSKGARGRSRWVGRILELLIPFLISAFLESRKQDQKHINNS